MRVIGSEGQERRLVEMSEVAAALRPEPGLPAFKGAYRYSIKAAMALASIEAWEELEKRAEEQKRGFFLSVLSLARGRLRGFGLNEAEIAFLEGEQTRRILPALLDGR